MAAATELSLRLRFELAALLPLPRKSFRSWAGSLNLEEDPSGTRYGPFLLTTILMVEASASFWFDFAEDPGVEPMVSGGLNAPELQKGK